MAHPENDIRTQIVDNLSQQLSEFESLKSMYPMNDEIVLTDNTILNDIQCFLDNDSEYTPNHLDYTLNLHISELKLEICINLPTMYPEEEPDIFVRCNQLNRQQETQLNSELSCYVKNNHSGDVFLYSAISWVQDNIDKFKINQNNAMNEPVKQEKHPDDDKYVRLWIYSHHIYSRRKRDEIVKRAKELRLTGFCLPGKPGIICIEGINADCNEWWRDIKSMTWKKINVRITEELESILHQKFENFEEVTFKNSSLHSNKHADMSQFYKYVEAHGLSQVFNDVFRLSNE